MENLTYITGNYGKYVSVKEKFENAYEKSYKAIIVFTNPKTNLDLNNL